MKILCYTYSSPKALVIQLQKSIFQPIHKIVEELDMKVFHQQLATGSYFGRFQVNESQLELMRLLANNGKIHPYFFCDSASGQKGYEIVFNPGGIILQSGHAIADEPLSVTISPLNIHKIRHKKLSFQQLPKRYTDFYQFNIEGKELKKLVNWKHWHQQEAFSGRYSYFFGGTSLGRIVKVTDQQDQSQIDLTDYDDW